ncbi:hypothetical protein A2U01_0102905, partial [Trifolium medium]|nr:hypothetical protein [Trifolium medium]
RVEGSKLASSVGRKGIMPMNAEFKASHVTTVRSRVIMREIAVLRVKRHRRQMQHKELDPLLRAVSIVWAPK